MTTVVVGTAEVWKFAPAYELPSWPFVAPPDLAARGRVRYRVVIAGAGLAGLTLACDLALRGIEVVVLDEDDTVGVRGASSRGICYAQKSLEIFARLGVYERIRAKGITWSVGRTFSGADEVYSFNLDDDSLSEQPPFINLQQFYLEWFLVERIVALAPAAIRWKSKVLRVEHGNDGAVVEVETPAGAYALEAEWFVDATGANSRIRDELGLDAHASRHTDRWCISDVRFKKPFAVERWTWIDAPFNESRAVWQHLMADAVWRLDYQMDEHADPESISRPEVAGARLRAQLGADVEFEFVWIGPYQYRDHLLDTFRVGRTIFVGDAAHVVCPFGARGGNNGIQDAANLGWKLALVLQGRAGEALVDSYQHERHAAAAENLSITSRTARFLAPRSAAEHRLRRAVVALARTHEFARRLANTGRMAQANAYPPSPWAPDGARSLQNVAVDGTTVMGLLGDGTRFLGLWLGMSRDAAAALEAELGARWPLAVHALDAASALARHLDAASGSFVLVRPDAYVAARIEAVTPAAIASALDRALSLAGAP
ncbi:MAG TPA: FAD-dependent oxidoreductase [Caldimonas sp.]|jgi:3-(3-hydroxy-phenyl)propionate hydroxylase|nr:FAD-dependent oxidoreductase [Caldimonas sp.]HEV7576277.1 FAD-dependent oxidoreductase [Caldimonas sp.]